VSLDFLGNTDLHCLVSYSTTSPLLEMEVRTCEPIDQIVQESIDFSPVAQLEREATTELQAPDERSRPSATSGCVRFEAGGFVGAGDGDEPVGGQGFLEARERHSMSLATRRADARASSRPRHCG